MRLVDLYSLARVKIWEASTP